MAAITEELAQLSETKPKGQAKRKPLPPELPRTEIHHEPESTTCACGCQLKRIGEDVAEKLDYTPGTFTVERHIRGKWACSECETLVQAPVPAHVIDKGIPTTGLLAHVLIAKFLGHLPLYRQEGIFGRAGSVSYTHLDVYKRQAYLSKLFKHKELVAAAYHQGVVAKGDDRYDGRGLYELHQARTLVPYAQDTYRLGSSLAKHFDEVLQKEQLYAAVGANVGDLSLIHI